jgi:hypothetical protein
MEIVIKEDKIMYVEMISCKASFNVILWIFPYSSSLSKGYL